MGGVIDIEALRDHRARAQWDNWLKDLRTELYQILYEQPIYPKNLYLDARADEARGVPREGHPARRSASCTTGNLGQTRPLTVGPQGRRATTRSE